MSAAIVDRRAAALKRAANAKLFAYKLDADTYEVPSSTVAGQMHLVRRINADAWSCTCAAHAHPWCIHRETACYAAEQGIRASRTAAPKPGHICPNCTCTPVSVHGDWCRGCLNLKHADQEQAVVRAAEAVMHRAYEGAEKALGRLPTSITRVAVKNDPFGDWA